MKNLILILIPIFIWSCRQFPDVRTQPEILVDDLHQHIAFLSSDEMEGRLAGSRFDEITAQYLARQFEHYGLEKIDGSYFQEFEFRSGVEPGPGSFIHIKTPNFLKLTDRQFSVMGFSSSDTVQSELVFAGYGITEPEVDYDDYAGLDVTGKTVLVMRFTPEGNTRGTPFSKHAPFRHKAKLAQENGARAIWFVTGPEHADSDDPLVAAVNAGAASELGIPAFHVKHDVADQILADNGHPSLSELQDMILNESQPTPFSFNIGATVQLRAELYHTVKTSRNVAGALPGYGKLKDEWIVVGAHFDHLGWGGPATTSKAPGVYDVHNGADDNASGTAGLLELAEFFAEEISADSSRRSILFMGFGAEELGLLGSSYAANHPLVPLDQTVAMLNLDMIGTLSSNNMILGGTGTSTHWEALLNQQNTDQFNLSFNAEGYGSGDHQSFFLKNIPVLFFFTGAHERYHKPTDDIEFINFEGLLKVTRYVQRCLHQIAVNPERPDFIKAENPSAGHQRGYSVTIGVIPDFTFTGDGFRISDVRSNGPAAKAGMKPQDIIISMNGISVLNIHDYMYALEQSNTSHEVPVEVLRDETQITLMVTPSKKTDASRHPE